MTPRILALSSGALPSRGRETCRLVASSLWVKGRSPHTNCSILTLHLECLTFVLVICLSRPVLPGHLHFCYPRSYGNSRTERAQVALGAPSLTPSMLLIALSKLTACPRPPSHSPRRGPWRPARTSLPPAAPAVVPQAFADAARRGRCCRRPSGVPGFSLLPARTPAHRCLHLDVPQTEASDSAGIVISVPKIRFRALL